MPESTCHCLHCGHVGEDREGAKVASEPEAGDSTSSGPLQKAVYSQIRFRRRGSPNVRFAPQAPELFRHRKMTRWASSAIAAQTNHSSSSTRRGNSAE